MAAPRSGLEGDTVDDEFFLFLSKKFGLFGTVWQVERHQERGRNWHQALKDENPKGYELGVLVKGGTRERRGKLTIASQSGRQYRPSSL